MTFSLDQLMLEDQPTLDSSQLFVLKSAIQNIDNFFTILQNPSLSVNKEKLEADKKPDDTTPQSRFTIQGIYFVVLNAVIIYVNTVGPLYLLC